MSVLAKEASPIPDEAELRVNDFNINVATVNGSGSQTSNNVLIRSLFKMGIPVTGKNLFPSNIQGLPTWYTVRLSKEGYLARREGIEVGVCMNPATVADDMQDVTPGGIILYDDSLPIAARRKDVKYYPMPVKEMVKEADLPFNLRDYVANMVYVGFVAYLLELDLDEVKRRAGMELRGQTQADCAQSRHGACAPITGPPRTSPTTSPTAPNA